MVEFLDKVLCSILKNTSFNSVNEIVKITVVGEQGSCNNKANILNPILNAIEEPVQLDFVYSFGRYRKGKWNGAIGQLVYNRSDVAIGTFTATYERSQWTQLSTPLGYSSPVAILSGRIPQNSIDNEFQVFNTFSWQVWFAFFLTILIVGLINNFIDFSNSKINNLITNILRIYQSALGQGVKQFNYVCCFKHSILIGSFLLTFNILMEYFDLLILSNLLSDNFIKIDSIDDLVNLISSTKLNITLVSSKEQLTWQLIEKSEEEKFQKNI